MKKLISCFLLLCLSLTFIFCPAYAEKNTTRNLAEEHWQQLVSVKSYQYFKHASVWFSKGEPSLADLQKRHDSKRIVMKVTHVNLSSFKNIMIKGDFKVQLFGAKDENSVYAYGSKKLINQISVSVDDETLCIEVDPKNQDDMRPVIIRIGVHELNALSYEGAGSLEGVYLNGKNLVVDSDATGDMYLSGHLDLKKVTSNYCGDINILGAYSNDLVLESNDSGDINIAGHAGLRLITHRGTGNINVVDARGKKICIDTSGAGKISLFGVVDINNIEAHGKTCVVAYPIASRSLTINAFDSSKIGLAGQANYLSVNAHDHALVSLKNLVANNAYVKTQNDAHVNVIARNQLFANAVSTSSIYYYGKPGVITPFTNGTATVLEVR